MADTRCANPEYQFDVDNLMLEYVVYKAIESHLRLLRVLSVTPGSHANEGGRIFDLFSEAARLTETFDILLNLFKQNYGNKSVREPVFIDADVLRFLVLLILWLQRRINLNGPRLEISPDSMQRWQLDLKVNRFFRKLWLKARGNESSAVDSILETDHANPALCLAGHLLPHFMYLSEKMQPTDTNLSEKWMTVAAEFMVQASIEILEAPNFSDDTGESTRVALEECFAWGYVRRATFESEIDQLVKQANDRASGTPDRTSECYEHIREIALSEDQCWRMFYDGPTKLNGRTNAGSSAAQSSGEVWRWTKLRQETLNEVLTTFTTMQEEDDTPAERPVAWLKNRHQLNTFLEELGRFLAASWGLVHSIDWFGKPVLIQIEEGGLEGMNGEEFEAFKVRAGIDSRHFGFTRSIV